MTRVDELQKKYPNLAREIVIKWDVLTQGLRDSEVLDKVGVWERGGSFQSRDLQGVSLKAMAGKRPGAVVRPGFVLQPDPFYMRNGIGVDIRRSFTSPYEIKEVGDGRFGLYEGEEKIEDVFFAGPKPRSTEAVTSKGTPVTSLVSGRGRCFRIAPVRYCEYFNQGEQCKFCNYNSTYDDARSVGHTPAKTIDLVDTIEAYKIISSQVRLVEGRFQMGGFRKSEQEAKILIDFVEQIATGASYTPNMAISTQPMDRKDMLRLKDTGLACLEFNLEVWGAELFEEVCPGKARHRGLEHYKEA
ncbi:MAG: hypothetical protein Q7O66_01875, partial [Dehalococcoidia bacterium]|nr:hypothetical protein [Dehalococcoidia bacterium]